VRLNGMVALVVQEGLTVGSTGGVLGGGRGWGGVSKIGGWVGKVGVDGWGRAWGLDGEWGGYRGV
jgi:hypothetical protein